MKLRPHHLLCIQKFVGYGYDEEFTKQLSKKVELLNAQPRTEITLVEGCDEVCIACPNKVEGSCTDGEKVIKLDNAVLEACGLNYGSVGTWEELSRTAKEIFSSDKFESVCGLCQWFEICKNAAD